MSTAVAQVGHRTSEAVWAGTATLLRLALRRDRIRLTIWLVLLTLMMAYTPVSYTHLTLPTNREV